MPKVKKSKSSCQTIKLQKVNYFGKRLQKLTYAYGTSMNVNCLLPILLAKVGNKHKFEMPKVFSLLIGAEMDHIGRCEEGCTKITKST